MRNILIVEDEKLQAKIFKNFLIKSGYNAIVISSGKEFLDFYFNQNQKIDGLSITDIDIILLDICMPKVTGIDILKKTQPHSKKELKFIVLSAISDPKTISQAISYGADDYIVKSNKDIYVRIEVAVNNALEKIDLFTNLSNAERYKDNNLTFRDIAFSSEEMEKVIATTKAVADSNILILIKGEKGVGKEMLARIIHSESARFGKSFVVFNFKTVDPKLQEEQLFGIEEPQVGKKKYGKIFKAEEGTILFKNIEYSSPEVQLKILKLLQSSTVSLKSSSKEIKLKNPRIMSSSTLEIANFIDEKKFREDLYYRLGVFTINVPSLRQRGREDVKLLSQKFVQKFSTQENKKSKILSDGALKVLQNHAWPKNISELERVIFRAVLNSTSEIITVENLPKEIYFVNQNIGFAIESYDDKSEFVNLFKREGICKTFQELEHEIVIKLTNIFNKNLSEVAKRLKVGRSTVYRKLQK
jgi:DNA-binding NtrC family response regulator